VAGDRRDLKESAAIPESQERRVLMGHLDLLDHLDHQVKEESVVRADQSESQVFLESVEGLVTKDRQVLQE
jgi:hypothetical protein